MAITSSLRPKQHSRRITNHALLQSPPTAARHGYHFITAAQATQQMNYRVPEEGKNGGNDTSNMEGERKADMVGALEDRPH
ncbi:hypothetical protein NC651_007814 [Populus alba x Populus x berolinensis]|nr:hypothetical protein NC651_007814 [Populus alba x Populus x berolinensis]